MDMIESYIVLDCPLLYLDTSTEFTTVENCCPSILRFTLITGGGPVGAGAGAGAAGVIGAVAVAAAVVLFRALAACVALVDIIDCSVVILVNSSGVSAASSFKSAKPCLRLVSESIVDGENPTKVPILKSWNALVKANSPATTALIAIAVLLNGSVIIASAMPAAVI